MEFSPISSLAAGAVGENPSTPETINLPLVSVVITNYNYAAFIDKAVLSVMGQSYPHVECIIVDDCSTDHSRSVIEGLIKRFPEIRVFFNEKNSGQSISCINGLKLTRGAYVIFLDADDFLLPSCIETHIYVHLSLRAAVGFTSVDMLQLVNERLTTTTSQGFADYIRYGAHYDHNLVRSFTLNGERFSAVPKLNDKLHYVHPKDCGLWPWSPTSANCFRKDALDFVLDNPRLAKLRTSTDTYMVRGVAALFGSVLIDMPLVAYRIHGVNNFICRATLHHARVFHVSKFQSVSQTAMTLLIDHIIDNIGDLNLLLENPHYIVEALTALNDTWPRVESSRPGISYLTECLLKRRKTIIRIVGLRTYLKMLFPQTRVLYSYLIVPFLPFIYWAVDHGLVFPRTEEG